MVKVHVRRRGEYREVLLGEERKESTTCFNDSGVFVVRLPGVSRPLQARAGLPVVRVVIACNPGCAYNEWTIHFRPNRELWAAAVERCILKGSRNHPTVVRTHFSITPSGRHLKFFRIWLATTALSGRTRARTTSL